MLKITFLGSVFFLFQQGKLGPDKAPKVGEKAPDFRLLKLDIEKEKDDNKAQDKSEDQKEQTGTEEKSSEKEKPEYVKLSDFKDKKDVVLIFGSYT